MLVNCFAKKRSYKIVNYLIENQLVQKTVWEFKKIYGIKVNV